jgi:hypothetical protein
LGVSVTRKMEIFGDDLQVDTRRREFRREIVLLNDSVGEAMGPVHYASLTTQVLDVFDLSSLSHLLAQSMHPEFSFPIENNDMTPAQTDDNPNKARCDIDASNA